MKNSSFTNKKTLLFFTPIYIILFVGVNVLYTIGLKDPFNDSSSFIHNVNWGIFWIITTTLVHEFSTKSILKDKLEISLFVFALFFILFYIVVLKRPANVGIILNAFIGPCLTRLFLNNHNQYKEALFKLILFYFLIECGISIIERVMQHNFFITRMEDSGPLMLSANTDFRSIPIHGHPLQGALMVTIVMSYIYVSRIKFTYKILFLGLGFTAILGYNTRSSMVYWGGMIFLLLLHHLFFSKNATKKNKILIVTILLISCLGFNKVVESGWGGRLFEMSLYDQDSASVRVDLFYMFNYVSIQDLLWGVDPDYVEYIKFKSGIAIIENYWVIYIFSFGIIGTIIFILFTYFCLKPLFKGFGTIKTLISVGSFLLISSTNNSMAVNTIAMILFVMCAYSFPIKNTKKTIYDTKKNSLLLVRKKSITSISKEMH